MAGPKPAERWNVGKRLRDVEEGPDGSLWMLEDSSPGALIHVSQVTTSHEANSKPRGRAIRSAGEGIQQE